MQTNPQFLQGNFVLPLKTSTMQTQTNRANSPDRLLLEATSPVYFAR